MQPTTSSGSSGLTFDQAFPVLYKGWDQAAAQADFNATGGTNKAGYSDLISSLPGGNTGGGGLTTPTSSDQLTSYANNFQDLLQQAKSAVGTPKSDEQILADVKSTVTPLTPPPAVPNLVQTFTDLSTTYGIPALNKSLTDTQAQIDAINNQLESQQASEEGKPVPLNVIAGRETEEQRQAGIQLDVLNRQMTRITNQINMAYTMVNTIVQLTNTDYQNAETQYQNEFTNNMSIYNAYETTKNNQVSNILSAVKTESDITSAEANITIEDTKIAQANLQTFANLVVSGNINLNNLDPTTKAAVTAMEVQSGVGIGFLNSIKSDLQNGKLAYAGTYGYLIQTQDANGQSSFKWTQTRSPQSVTQITKLAQQDTIDSAQADLESHAGPDGFVSPQDYQAIKDAATSTGDSSALTPSQFDTQFKGYKNPANLNYH